MLSTRLIHAVRLHPVAQWRLAQRAGLHPSILSRWLHGMVTPAADDPRLRRLARIVDVPLDEALDNRRAVEVEDVA